MCTLSISYPGIDHLCPLLVSGLHQIAFAGHAQEMSTLSSVNTEPEPDLVAMAAGAAGSQRVMAHWAASSIVFGGSLTGLHLMVTADFFLSNDHIRRFQDSSKGEEVEMKLRGPEAPFN